MLHALLSHSELIPDARRAANALLASVSFAAVAKSIVDALVELGLDDLDAGPHAGGYVEPSEAAWETIGQAVAPYLRDAQFVLTPWTVQMDIAITATHLLLPMSESRCELCLLDQIDR